MKNFSIVSTDQNAARTELHDRLGLTGAEVSINTIPAGGSVPFVHWHRKNEEIYGIISGSGRFGGRLDQDRSPGKAPHLRLRGQRHLLCLHPGEGRLA